jgi:dihydroorotate dehydrogenase electron transfer subunit
LIRCPDSRVVQNERLRNGLYLMKVEAPSIARGALPGHFVMLKSLTPDWPYLKRPFSVYSSDGEAYLDLVYKVVGPATSVMARVKDGDRLELLGPCGNSFRVSGGRNRVIALAGGVGLPPLAFYCQKYSDFLDEITLILGATNRDELLLPINLVVQGVDLKPFTDDGSKGDRGTVVDGFRTLLEERSPDPDRTAVIACGPRRMLGGVAALCETEGLACTVCVEEVMACGVGACLACAVPSRAGGYLHACTDGPVFDAALIDWEKWLERSS